MMWLLTSVVSIVLLDTWAHFCSAASMRSKQTPVALIHHPRVALDYFLKTEAHRDHKRLQEFRKLDDVSKKEASLDHLVGAISFSLPQDRIDYVTEECVYFMVGRLKVPRNSFTDDLSFMSPDGRQRRTSAQIYHAKNDQESWAIAPGYHEGVLIVFNKQIDSPDSDLFGLLERPPDVIYELTRAQLEGRYVTGKFDFSSEIEDAPSSDRDENRRSLCELSDHERFRVCSVGYLAWNYSGKVTNDVSYRGPEGNYIDLKPPTSSASSKCIKGKIILELETEEKFEGVDVIPCAVNTDAMHANFFLTGDRFSADSMFKVKPLWKKEDCSDSRHSIDDKTIGYELEFFMTNVRVLKQTKLNESTSVDNASFV